MAATRGRASRAPRPNRAAHADSLIANPAVRQILGGAVTDLIESAFTQMGWAEEEIETAAREHSAHAQRLSGAFALLAPTHPLMKTEMVYRAHCREILARVVAGEDTRPGTAAECCCACCDTSQVAPLNLAGAGLYMRMWKTAGFPEIGELSTHYEALRSQDIDQHERTVRHRLRVDSRRLPDPPPHEQLALVSPEGAA